MSGSLTGAVGEGGRVRAVRRGPVSAPSLPPPNAAAHHRVAERCPVLLQESPRFGERGVFGREVPEPDAERSRDGLWLAPLPSVRGAVGRRPLRLGSSFCRSSSGA